MRTGELLRVADAAMRIHADTSTWLQGMCAALQLARPRAVGAIAYTYRVGAGGVLVSDCHTAGAAIPEMNDEGLAALGSERTVEVFGNRAMATTASGTFGGQLPPALEASWARFGVRDVLGLVATLDEGDGLLVGTVESTLAEPAVGGRTRVVAETLRTALLLRSALSGRRLEDAVEAIFSPSGALEALGSRACALPLRSLGDLVQCREGARRLAERDDVTATEFWAGLCSGRYRLVDYVDRDGKRFVVLLAADAHTAQALTPVERKIAELCGRAASNKQIAFALGLTESAVENHVSRVLGKLGLKQRVDLVRVYTDLEHAAA